jgi:hypothetical protein
MQHLLPQRIVCLTEETTEWLYLLGQEARIVGISGYTVRPRRAREEKPKVSAFLTAKIDKILALKPDCVFGFSDLQADIASLLIRAGVQVTVFNQRSVDEIFSVLYQVAAMVGEAEQGMAQLSRMRAELDAITARTVTDPAALRRILDGVRAQGWAEVDGELDIGLKALAVPVTDRDGVWLDARNVRVDWSYWPLITRRFHATDISAEVIQLIRRPVLDAPSGEPGGPIR